MLNATKAIVILAMISLFSYIFLQQSFCFRLIYYTGSWLQAIVSFITMQLQLCSVFFTFSLGTKTHYFGRTILHGGAKVCLLCYIFCSFVILQETLQYFKSSTSIQYHATGRGFVVRHIKFSENYRLYSRSHFVKGFVPFFSISHESFYVLFELC